MFMYFGQVSAISDEFFPAAWKKFAYLKFCALYRQICITECLAIFFVFNSLFSFLATM